MADTDPHGPLGAAERRAAWLFLAPFGALLGVFFLFAAARTAWFSLTDYDLFSEARFVGLRNYGALLTDDLFLLALRNSLMFAVIVTTAQTVLALILAVFVNGIVRGRGAARTALYFPSIVSSTVMTLIFIWLFQRRGLVTDAANWVANEGAAIACFALVLVAVQTALVWNARRRYDGVAPLDPYFLIFAVAAALAVTVLLRTAQILPAGEADEPISWLNTRRTWLGMPVTLWSVAAINVFTTIPLMMLLYLAGLQSIPRDLYEAAEIDGASRRTAFLRITVPLLAPVTFAVVTLGLIGTLQMFDQVAILGNAAPIESRVTLAYYTYYNAFPPGGAPRIGMASAGAITLAVLTLGIVFLQRALGISDRAA
ncbi:carbohydrate ABC transporter membrane protein 1 (CUT1 family) [Hasllibacter halocynthiae]|uniref:Carbohydrate ABC transporter membrane protein 1 (CUT1 family) n=1 Tax=Hasllibacter halocynthiae TaxID=595589 RepID=A0A2T0WZF2_9RHOB|nr:sugar ABC transporter permease [Hasllibacter halocynthiae]PRY92083.1 carbohydrate ABC transporter membrane protein 1 (CUT1 family) [Hasllibacter halocynthiae]